MKRFFLILFIGITCLSTFNQCRKKGQCLGTYSFTSQDKQIIPYQKDSTFVLIDSLGLDSIKFQVNRIEDFNHWLYDENIYEYSDYMEYMDFYLTEEYTVYIFSYFRISMNFTNPYEPPVYKSVLFDLDIQSHPEIQDFYGYCDLNDGTLYTRDNPVSNYNLFVSHLDTLNICNKQFYSVYSLSPKVLPSDTTIGIIKLFYSFDKGLVGIKTNNWRTWRLK